MDRNYKRKLLEELTVGAKTQKSTSLHDDSFMILESRETEVYDKAGGVGSMLILILHNDDCIFKLPLYSATCSVFANIVGECSAGRMIRFFSLEVDETRDKSQLKWVSSSSKYAMIDAPDNKLKLPRTTTEIDFMYSYDNKLPVTRMVIVDLDSIIPDGDEGLLDLSCNRCNKRFSNYKPGYKCFRCQSQLAPGVNVYAKAAWKFGKKGKCFQTYLTPDNLSTLCGLSHSDMLGKLKNKENIDFPIGESYRIIFSISAKGGTKKDKKML